MELDAGLPQTQYDVIIIGAGPAGLATAIYTSSLRLKTLVLEGSTSPRLQLAHTVNNYPGFPEGITGTDLLQRFREQALKFGTDVRRGDIIAVNLVGDVKTVATRDTVASAKSVVIATGIQQKRTEVPGEEKFLGVGVSYCVICDGPLFRGKIVAVVGDASEALEDALTMSRIAAKTYLMICFRR